MEREAKTRAGAALLVTAYLAEQYRALADGDVALREGPAAVHSTRVATRRLRSTIRVFAPLFDDAAAHDQDVELAWYAGLLGQVRDLQVLRARFAAALAEMPPDEVVGPVQQRIDSRLSAEQQAHYETLIEAMDGDRYRTLLTTAAGWAVAPPLTLKADKKAKQLRRYMKRARHKATKGLTRALARPADDHALHQARKAAKRARYAVELTAPCFDETTSDALIDAYKRAQDLLGEHQDSLVAANVLRMLAEDAGDVPGLSGFTYGLLYARERDVARHTLVMARGLAKRSPYTD